MPDVVFSVDQAISMRDQKVPGHNRWHPDIPVAAMVKPGDDFRVECPTGSGKYMTLFEVAKEIADRLELSVDTVRSHLKHIYEKMHVRSRTEAVARYMASNPGASDLERS